MGGTITTYISIPQGDFAMIVEDINQIKQMISQRNHQEQEIKWVDSEEATKILNISKRTLQRYRDEKTISFSQFGRKIYYNKAELEAFIPNHLIGGEINE